MIRLLNDILFGLRVLRRQIGMTLTAIVVIAAGTGVNAAMFAVLNSLFLQPLPFSSPERMTSITSVDIHGTPGTGFLSYPDFRDLRREARLHQYLATWYERDLVFEGSAGPVWIRAVYASDDLFPLLGVRPLMGRAFSAASAAEDDDAVILSYEFWRRSTGGDPQSVGRKVMLNGKNSTIIGVMPPGFHFPRRWTAVDVWAKFTDNPAQAETVKRDLRGYQVIGRLADGATLSQSQQELERQAATLRHDFPATNANVGADVTPFTWEVSSNLRTAVWVLTAAVGFVLLISCVTVATLLLAAGSRRESEIATRSALGASRGRLIRQLMTEYITLAIAGTVAGVAVGAGILKVLVRFIPAGLPQLPASHPDWRFMVFAAALALLTGVFCGLVPAFRASTISPASALGQRSSTAGAGVARSWIVLIVAQIAGTEILLVGAGLLIHSFWQLRHIDTGLKTSNVLTAAVAVPDTYGPRGTVAVYERLRDSLRSVPGVEAVSGVSPPPLHNQVFTMNFGVEGSPSGSVDQPTAQLLIVEPGYFRAMGIPIVRGDDFPESDRPNQPPMVVVNEVLAGRYLGGRDPIGMRLKLGPVTQTIAGVVGAVRHVGPAQAPGPEIYVRLSRRPVSEMLVVIKSDRPISVGTVQSKIRETEGNIAVYDLQTLDERLDSSLGLERLDVSILMLFAGIALLLSMIGIHGVVSYATGGRKQEIALRLALGATREEIVRNILTAGMRTALIGIVAGCAGALVLTRLMAALFFGLSSMDPVTYAAMAGLMGAVCLSACYLPARRAVRADLMPALRAE